MPNTFEWGDARGGEEWEYDSWRVEVLPNDGGVVQYDLGAVNGRAVLSKAEERYKRQNPEKAEVGGRINIIRRPKGGFGKKPDTSILPPKPNPPSGDDSGRRRDEDRRRRR